MAPIPLELPLAGALAAVHLLAGKLRFVQVIPRNHWLSMSGGVSVAYVFVHLLPEIAARQFEIATDVASGNAVAAAASEQLLFVATLLGFAAFYGLELAAHRSRRDGGADEIIGGVASPTAASVFWIHISSFAVYNALVGYLLVHREESGAANLLLYATAMALHFVVNDHGLRDHHRTAYDRVGRWILAVAVVAGLGGGYVVRLHEPAFGLLLAFLAGGIILNVIKEELPEERQSRFWAFGVGLAVYTLVLLFL